MEQFKYPLRVGRKQKRAILDAYGKEVCIFHTGSEEIAQEFCDFMNLKNSVSRVELITSEGRMFVSRGEFELSIQDECRTLKIFKNDV